MKSYGFRKVLLLFRCLLGGSSESGEMKFVQFMRCVIPLDAVEDAVGCAYLQWSAAEGEKNKTDADKLKKGISHSAAWEEFGVILFKSILNIVHVFLANIVVHPFYGKAVVKSSPFLN